MHFLVIKNRFKKLLYYLFVITKNAEYAVAVGNIGEHISRLGKPIVVALCQVHIGFKIAVEIIGYMK
jgi:hypothetical protein